MKYMRTRTTTRESTWNRDANYPLLVFLWANDMTGPYDRLKRVMFTKVVTDPAEITDDEDEAFEIRAFLKSKL